MLAIHPYSWKNTLIFTIVLYLHFDLQRFFIDISSKFSNSLCWYTAYENFATLLSLMQRITGYLMTLQD